MRATAAASGTLSSRLAPPAVPDSAVHVPNKPLVTACTPVTNPSIPCRRQRDLQRANEMAERERRTQELLRSSEAGVVAKKQKARSNWHIGMNRALAQNVSQEKVRLYQEAFDRIQAATGEGVEGGRGGGAEQ